MVGHGQPAACRRKEIARNDATQDAPEIRSALWNRVLAAAEGLDVRKTPPLRKAEKCFFLTSPFIEPGEGEIIYWSGEIFLVWGVARFSSYKAGAKARFRLDA
jgi:hypothetical protein